MVRVADANDWREDVIVCFSVSCKRGISPSTICFFTYEEKLRKRRIISICIWNDLPRKRE